MNVGFDGRNLTIGGQPVIKGDARFSPANISFFGSIPVPSFSAAGQSRSILDSKFADFIGKMEVSAQKELIQKLKDFIRVVERNSSNHGDYKALFVDECHRQMCQFLRVSYLLFFVASWIILVELVFASSTADHRA